MAENTDSGRWKRPPALWLAGLLAAVWLAAPSFCRADAIALGTCGCPCRPTTAAGKPQPRERARASLDELQELLQDIQGRLQLIRQHRTKRKRGFDLVKAEETLASLQARLRACQSNPKEQQRRESRLQRDIHQLLRAVSAIVHVHPIPAFVHIRHANRVKGPLRLTRAKYAIDGTPVLELGRDSRKLTTKNAPAVYRGTGLAPGAHVVSVMLRYDRAGTSIQVQSACRFRVERRRRHELTIEGFRRRGTVGVRCRCRIPKP